MLPVFILSMIVAVLPAALMRLFGCEKASDSWMRINGTLLSRIIIWVLHARIEVEGLERIPRDGTPVCFVANHQSILDIPAVVAGLRIWAGFIAKKELKRIPVVSSWIASINCVYIDRKSPRSSIEAILKGVENIRNGIPMFVFPEGTRSKTGRLGEFKSGSLKLATRAKAVIVPIAINGTRRAWESKKGIRLVRIRMSVAEPIRTADLDDRQMKELPDRVYEAVSQRYLALVSGTI